MAVSLALMGARGNTEAEMLRGLKLSGTKGVISEQIHQLIEPLENSTSLKVANKVYVMENYRIKPEFSAIATKKFNSEAQTLNFARAAESAAVINKWVEDKTNDKIKDLIKPDALDSDTRMVLVNAIYFKGFWKHQFKKALTAKAPFYTSETDSVQVDMMHVKVDYSFRSVLENVIDVAVFHRNISVTENSLIWMPRVLSYHTRIQTCQWSLFYQISVLVCLNLKRI